ncbi:hypothetical protein Baya_13760 [Bagarius yarrelli]|uniref:Uncharacterized protein n=1 Tax=Bagarius yarrelli TaxID=175774 RepID=A0A556V8P5_BAGYA|nr:hypothetical protein Baya_13760 [Bagarius yarrelli]
MRESPLRCPVSAGCAAVQMEQIIIFLVECFVLHVQADHSTDTPTVQNEECEADEQVIRDAFQSRMSEKAAYKNMSSKVMGLKLMQLLEEVKGHDIHTLTKEMEEQEVYDDDSEDNDGDVISWAALKKQSQLIVETMMKRKRKNKL